MDAEPGMIDVHLSYAPSDPLIKRTTHTAAEGTDAQGTGHHSLQQGQFSSGDVLGAE